MRSSRPTPKAASPTERRGRVADWVEDGGSTGQPLDAVFRIVTKRHASRFTTRRRRRSRKAPSLGWRTIRSSSPRAGPKFPSTTVPPRSGGAKGEVVGCVLVFRDVTERAWPRGGSAEAGRATAGAGPAARGCRPPQERVLGDVGSRIAEPPGPDPQRRAKFS